MNVGEEVVNEELEDWKFAYGFGSDIVRLNGCSNSLRGITLVKGCQGICGKAW